MTNAITTKKAELQNSKKGFTLVELVVVIAILAILAAIAIPVVNSIINTASKNGALSNAQSIELAVKECQSYIASGNNEVYKANKTITLDSAKFATSSVTIHDAKTDHGNIVIQEVAAVKGIASGFDKVSYNGNDYYPYWDKVSQKCVFVTGTGNAAKDLDGNSVTVAQAAQGGQAATAGLVKLASTNNAHKIAFENVKVDDM